MLETHMFRFGWQNSGVAKPLVGSVTILVNVNLIYGYVFTNIFKSFLPNAIIFKENNTNFNWIVLIFNVTEYLNSN